MMTTTPSRVPIWPHFVIPVLSRLHQHDDVMTRRELKSLVVSDMSLDDEALGEVMESGQSRHDNRLGWALTNLVKNGMVERPLRAQYRITESGRHLLMAHPGGIQSFAEADRMFARGWEEQASAAEVEPDEAREYSPIERLDRAYDEARQNIESELIVRLRDSNPDFFEQAVIDVLIAMGFGGAEGRGKRIGGSGDGGVDGVIDQDALGLDQLYVQAKRYAAGNNVSGDAIRAFIGAVQSKGATRGVFITTSSFTPAATHEAKASRHARIVLIDGERLAKLMVEYRVGVQVTTSYDVYEIDEDFFE